MRAAQFISRLRGEVHADRDTSVEALLTRFKQSMPARRYLWEPLCISALNTPAAEASAQVFLNVLRDSLNGSREDSDLLLPAEDLGALFPEPAARFVAAAGGKVVSGCTVESVRREDKALAVISQHGLERFSHVVCALPPFRVPEVLRPMAELDAVLETVSRLRHEPITRSTYPPQCGCQAMLGLEGADTMALDRGQLSAQHGLIGVVISARGLHQDLDQDSLTAEVHAELQAALGLPRRYGAGLSRRSADLRLRSGSSARPSALRSLASTSPATILRAPTPHARGRRASGVACARMILAKAMKAPRRQDAKKEPSLRRAPWLHAVALKRPYRRTFGRFLASWRLGGRI